jgi:hypothetical protein
MGEAYGTQRGEEIQLRFLWGNLKNFDHLEQLCKDGRVIVFVY